MAKTLDYVALTIILTLLTFVFGLLAFQNAYISLAVSASLSLATVFSIKYFSRKKYRFSPSRLATHFSIKGNDYVVDLIKSTQNCEVETSSNVILLDHCAVFSCYKFGAVSAQDVASVAKAVENSSVKTVFVLSNGVDRKAYQVADYLGLRLKPVKIGAVYRYLDRHGALPDLKKPKRKISLPVVFETVFSRSNFKAYAFSGTILLFTAFITPLRTYYLISGSICLLLALFSLVFGNGNLFALNAFKELKNAADKNCVSKNSDKGSPSDD